jgi:hypothetical protein
MFKFRQLAAGIAVSLGLAGAAQPLFAQSVIDFVKDEPVKKEQPVKKTNGAENTDNPFNVKSDKPSSSSYDPEALYNHLRNSFKGVNTHGKGEKRYFSVERLNYTLISSKQEVSWNVEFGHITRGNKQFVRLYFSCQSLPMEVNSDRFKAMMNWSGDHAGTTAFFKTIGNGKTEQLYIVADYPTETAANLDWRKEVNAMFVMADETLYLWGSDLSLPVTKKQTKEESPKETPKAKEEAKLNINGGWDGRVFVDDKEVGQYSMQFMDGIIISSRARYKDSNIQMLTGTYTLDGDQLTIEYKDEKPETLTAVMDGKTLVLVTKNGTVIKMKKSR